MSESKGFVLSAVSVDVDLAEAQLHDLFIRLIEVDVDTTAYNQGHMPGAAIIPRLLAVRDDVTFKSADEYDPCMKARELQKLKK